MIYHYLIYTKSTKTVALAEKANAIKIHRIFFYYEHSKIIHTTYAFSQATTPKRNTENIIIYCGTNELPLNYNSFLNFRVYICASRF